MLNSVSVRNGEGLALHCETPACAAMPSPFCNINSSWTRLPLRPLFSQLSYEHVIGGSWGGYVRPFISEIRELTLCEKTRDRRTEDANTFGRARGPMSAVLPRCKRLGSKYFTFDSLRTKRVYLAHGAYQQFGNYTHNLLAPSCAPLAGAHCNHLSWRTSRSEEERQQRTEQPPASHSPPQIYF